MEITKWEYETIQGDKAATELGKKRMGSLWHI